MVWQIIGLDKFVDLSPFIFIINMSTDDGRWMEGLDILSVLVINFCVHNSIENWFLNVVDDEFDAMFDTDNHSA